MYFDQFITYTLVASQVSILFYQNKDGSYQNHIGTDFQWVYFNWNQYYFTLSKKLIDSYIIDKTSAVVERFYIYVGDIVKISISIRFIPIKRSL